jgi:hypothetical protein
MRILIAWALVVLALSSGQAAAEMVELLGTHYQPVMDTQAGRIDSCGIMFGAAVKTMKGRMLVLKGSVNTTYWKDKLPVIIIKLSATEFVNSATQTPLKVRYASVRAGELDTRALKSVDGDEGAKLLGGNILEHEKLYTNFPTSFMSGAWISFSLDEAELEYTVRLRKFGEEDNDTFQEYHQCSKLGSAEVVKEMEALPGGTEPR